MLIGLMKSTLVCTYRTIIVAKRMYDIFSQEYLYSLGTLFFTYVEVQNCSLGNEQRLTGYLGNINAAMPPQMCNLI